MSIHKLTAGSGYDYLTRQVAALDATEKGHLGLASYYSERGETPGVWVGSGMDGIDGLSTGDVVTAEQMRALFGAGLHPLAAQRQQLLQGPELTARDYQAVTLLGAPFKIYQPDISPFRVEVAKRIVALNQGAGLPGDWAVPAADRARIRTEVAREFAALPGMLGPGQQHHQLPPQPSPACGAADPARPCDGVEQRPAAGRHQAAAGRQRGQKTAGRGGSDPTGAAVGGPGRPARPATPPTGRLAGTGAAHAENR
jgi:TrwC relaxase